ncbi:transcriptional repressor [Patescibacteria group bacterium]|nr:transcriptional repressor [Patescibacteria group bacterium]
MSTKTRQTKQKKAIFDVLEIEDTHLQADEVCRLVRKRVKNISLATIYRNLEAMTHKGVLHEVCVSGLPRWYEVKKYECHGHLFCKKCEQLFDVVDCGMCFAKNRMESKMNFCGEEVMFLVMGRCKECSEKIGEDNE